MKGEPQITKSPEPEPNNSDLQQTLQSVIDEFNKKGLPIELDLTELELKTGKSGDEIQKTLATMGYVDKDASPAVKPEVKASPTEKPKKRSQSTKQTDKTGWTDVDHKLEDAVNRLRKAKDEAEKDTISEEIKLLKETKFPDTKPSRASLTKKQKTATSPSPQTEDSAYDDDYTPKIRNVEAVASAVEDKERRDFIEKAAEHGAFESDYTPRERFAEQSTEVDNPEGEKKNVLDDLIDSLNEHGQSPATQSQTEVPPSDMAGAGNTENLISHEEWQALIGRRENGELHDGNSTPHDDFGFEEAQPETFESELEVMIRKAKEPGTRIYTVLSTILALARIQNNPGIFALTVERAHDILEKKNSALKVDPDNDIYNDLAKRELLEILEELKPAALEAEKNSTSHKIQTLNHENGKTNFDVEPDPAVGMPPNSAMVPVASPEAPAISEGVASEALKTIEKKRESRIQNLGKKFFNAYERIGNKYNELPTSAKIGVSVSLLTLAVASGGATMALSTAWRAVGTVGLSISLDKAIKIIDAKITGGKERSIAKRIIQGGGAVTLAILLSFFSADIAKAMGGEAVVDKIREILDGAPRITVEGQSGNVLNNSPSFNDIADIKTMNNSELDLPNATLDYVNTTDVDQITTNIEGGTESQIPATSAENVVGNNTQVAAEAISNHTIKQGETLTKIIQEKILANSGLEGARLTNATENILSAMRADPTKFGVTSGNLDLIKVGENIDVAKIKELANSISINGKNIIETANNLSAEQVANISNYKPNVTEVISSVTSSNPNVSETLSNSLDTWSGEGTGNEEVIEKIPDVEIKDASTNTDNTSNVAESSTTNTQKTINSELIEQVKFKADIELRQLVESKFGSKGIFGFLKNDGMNIWDNIKDIPVAKLDEFAKVGAFEAGSAEAKSFLVQPSTRDATFNILSELQEATGLKPAEKETIGKFISRMLEDTKMKALTSTKNITA